MPTRARCNNCGQPDICRTLVGLKLHPRQHRPAPSPAAYSATDRRSVIAAGRDRCGAKHDHIRPMGMAADPPGAPGGVFGELGRATVPMGRHRLSPSRQNGVSRTQNRRRLGQVAASPDTRSTAGQHLANAKEMIKHDRLTSGCGRRNTVEQSVDFLSSCSMRCATEIQQCCL